MDADYRKFMNHSTQPNLGYDMHAPHLYYALQDIAAGEELTCDYRLYDKEHSL